MKLEMMMKLRSISEEEGEEADAQGERRRSHVLKKKKSKIMAPYSLSKHY